MFAVTAADAKFKDIIGFWESRVVSCGLTPVIYDLGGLGEGEPFTPDVPGFGDFLQQGYYHLLADGQWKSRAVHKPLVCEKAMNDLHAPFLYLDADAILRGVPQKMYAVDKEFDVCITVRPRREWDKTVIAKREFIGRINAGVIWFNYTPNAKAFIEQWKTLTLAERNDQRALNLMMPRLNRKYLHSIPPGITIKPVPTELYNHYYTTKIERAVIVHLKNREWAGKTPAQLAERCRLRSEDRDYNHVVYDYFVDDDDFDLFTLVTQFDDIDIVNLQPVPNEESEVLTGGDEALPENTVPDDGSPGPDGNPLGFVENDPQGS